MAEEYRAGVDSGALDQADLELIRASILQNARFAARFDPFRALRTPKNEKRLSRLGAATCAVGLLVSLVGVFAAPSGPRNTFLILLPTFALLLLLFLRVAQARRWITDRTDGLVERRARRMLVSLRALVPYDVQYTLAGGVLTAHRLPRKPEDAPRFERKLDGLRYGLWTETVLVLLPSRTRQGPFTVVFAPESGYAELRDAIAAHGVELAVLRRELLPSALPRRW